MRDESSPVRVGQFFPTPAGTGLALTLYFYGEPYIPYLTLFHPAANAKFISAGSLVSHTDRALTITYTQSIDHAQKVPWSQESSMFLSVR